MESWDDAEAALERIVATSDEPFDDTTIANSRDLLAVARKDCRVPGDLAKGYWSTFRFCWSNFEVEVFDDHFETYHFAEKSTDIRHYPRRPGQPFPADFMDELASVRA